MTPAIAAMVTAVVGVFGTLSAPLLGQFLTGRQTREKDRSSISAVSIAHVLCSWATSERKE